MNKISVYTCAFQGTKGLVKFSIAAKDFKRKV